MGPKAAVALTALTVIACLALAQTDRAHATALTLHPYRPTPAPSTVQPCSTVAAPSASPAAPATPVPAH